MALECDNPSSIDQMGSRPMEATPRIISRSVVTAGTPPVIVPQLDLTPWDLTLIAVDYNQKGLLFTTPAPTAAAELVQHLRASLADALAHVPPLAGRLVTVDGAGDSTHAIVRVACSNEGAEFVHAAMDGVAVEDVLGCGGDVPPFVHSFFPLNGAVNYDGHALPLLAAQVTELVGGFFLGLTVNHAVADGGSFWQFVGAWAEISRTRGASRALSCPPVFDRSSMYFVLPVRLPSSAISWHGKERRPAPPLLRDRVFHFLPQALAALKEKAKNEIQNGKAADSKAVAKQPVSTFQALSSLLWRCLTRARALPAEQVTCYAMSVDTRPRMQPPLPAEYFGNAITDATATATAGELAERGHGFAALAVGQAVAAVSDKEIRSKLAEWPNKPFIVGITKLPTTNGDPRGSMIRIGSSHRFDVYGCDFGWGKPAAVRSGPANKFDGKVMMFPGREGGGSIDVEVCLSPETMNALLSDNEFMAATSSPAPTALVR